VEGSFDLQPYQNSLSPLFFTGRKLHLPGIGIEAADFVYQRHHIGKMVSRQKTWIQRKRNRHSSTARWKAYHHRRSRGSSMESRLKVRLWYFSSGT